MQQTRSISGPTLAASGSSIWQLGLYATVLSALTNGAVYAVLHWLLDPVPSRPTVEQAAGAILALSALGALGCTLLYALLRTCVHDALAVFRLCAAALMLLAVVAPLSLPLVPLALDGALEAMHVVVIAVTVGVFTRDIP